MTQLKCAILGHDWNTWKPEEPGSCLSVHKCSRCGKEERIGRHDFEWVEDVSHDFLLQICKKCGKQPELPEDACPYCSGQGFVRIGESMVYTTPMVCLECGGTGKRRTKG